MLSCFTVGRHLSFIRIQYVGYNVVSRPKRQREREREIKQQYLQSEWRNNNVCRLWIYTLHVKQYIH